MVHVVYLVLFFENHVSLCNEYQSGEWVSVGVFHLWRI